MIRINQTAQNCQRLWKRTMDDIYNLQRFISAQTDHYANVLDELNAGQKRSHWMWFIFPQIQGLGLSAIAQKYALASAAEANAYLEHPILGSRLRECTQLVLSIEARSAEQIFSFPDNLKFHSSMTLFANAAVTSDLFQEALFKYFAGTADPLTLDILNKQ